MVGFTPCAGSSASGFVGPTVGPVGFNSCARSGIPGSGAELGFDGMKVGFAGPTVAPVGFIVPSANSGIVGSGLPPVGGEVVGCGVGCSVGCGVGCSVGCGVGCGVGCSVGCSVGCEVGEAVGEAVGKAVGKA